MDFYELLEVDKNASKDDIKRAFRQKARKLHPDVNKEPDAEQKFKELGKAYETLMDDNKRALYDQYGEDGLSNAGYTQGPFDYGFGDISEIFSSFFGGGMEFGGGYSQRANANAPQRGDDLRVDIDITLKKPFGAQKKKLKLTTLYIATNAVRQARIKMQKIPFVKHAKDEEKFSKAHKQSLEALQR